MDQQQRAKQDQLIAIEPLRLSKRASIDQITFTDPEWHHSVPTSNRSNLPRNLSYIREISESNLGDDTKTRSQRLASPGHDGSNIAAAVLQLNRRHTTSTLSLPLSSVPERKSSRCILRRKTSRALGQLNDAPALPLPPPRGSGQTVPTRGSSVSPVRLAVASLDDTSSEMRRIPSRTFVRSVRPVDIVEFPKLKHPRVALDLRVSSPLFMGGGTVEGSLQIALDGGAPGGRYKSRAAMSIGRVLVDVLGVESSHGKHWIFRSLACELIDATHPPPNTMAASTGPLFDAFWETIPSSSVLPFRLNLPVNMGPPPYRSKQAWIRYIICATLAIKISGVQQFVRKSLEIAILSAHDPEKALVSLPSPLTAYNDFSFPGGSGPQVIKLTAGLHRQTWVSGIPMFVDVHISNTSRKIITRVELQLERVMFFFDHAAASTTTEAADHLRLPDWTAKEIVQKVTTKKARHGWKGIPPQARELQTRDIDVPAGLVTIDAGRFFGVRFFLNVLITWSISKHLVVQLPITIIHPNSLDIVPNSLAQVAAAIELKHSNRPRDRGGSFYQYSAGQAFTAARKQSLSDLSEVALPANEIDDLQRQLDGSPRKRVRKTCSRESGPPPRVSFASTRLTEEDVPARRPRRTRSSIDPRKGPRLQGSTSGLAFDDFGDMDGSSLLDASTGSGDPWSQGVRSRGDGQLQRELSLAEKRSKSLEYRGWKNVALEVVERNKAAETYGV